MTNRIVESVNMFDTIVNNRCFRSISVILIFNKTDLLVEKIRHKSIRDHFPDFQGDPRKLEDVQEYLVIMFNSVRQDKSQQLYPHFTTATDTKNINKVFTIIINDIILMKNIQDFEQI